MEQSATGRLYPSAYPAPLHMTVNSFDPQLTGPMNGVHYGDHYNPQFPISQDLLQSAGQGADSADEQSTKRRRINYRDPANAARLATALGILIRQKNENKVQDVKLIAAHFGLPYNTLRDNYLKVTASKNLRSCDEQAVATKAEAAAAKPDAAPEKEPVAAAPQPARSATSGRSPKGNSAPSAHPAVMAGPHPVMPYGAGAYALPPNHATFAHPGAGGMQMHAPLGNLSGPLPAHLQHAQPFAPMAAAFMQSGRPSLGQLPLQMQMQMQFPGMFPAGLRAGTDISAAEMQTVTAALVGYHVDPLNGRPYAIFAQPLDSLQQLNQVQAQFVPGPMNVMRSSGADHAGTSGGFAPPGPVGGSASPATADSLAHQISYYEQELDFSQFLAGARSDAGDSAPARSTGVEGGEGRHLGSAKRNDNQ